MCLMFSCRLKIKSLISNSLGYVLYITYFFPFPQLCVVLMSTWQIWNKRERLTILRWIICNEKKTVKMRIFSKFIYEISPSYINLIWSKLHRLLIDDQRKYNWFWLVKISEKYFKFHINFVIDTTFNQQYRELSLETVNSIHNLLSKFSIKFLLFVALISYRRIVLGSLVSDKRLLFNYMLSNVHKKR